MTESVFESVEKSCQVLKLDFSSAELAILAQEQEFSPEQLQAVAAVLEHLRQKKVDTTIQTLLKMSRLPLKDPKTFENFDFSMIKGRDVRRLQSLPSLSAIYAKRNLAFIGPLGTGKTHLAQAFLMNFTYLQNNSDLSVLFSCCKECEEFARNHPNISITAARKTVEYIVKLLYGTKINSDIRGLSLYEMLSDYDFREYLNDKTLLDAIHFIRRKGNQAVHEGNMNHDEAMEVLEKLHYVVGEVCIKLGVIDRYPPFDPEIVESCAQGAVSIAGEPEVDGALIKRLSERIRNRMKSAAHSKGNGRISNVHVSTTKEARALSQHKITRGTDSGANGKSAYQYLGGYIAKLLPEVQILMENVRSELILIKDNKGTIFAVKTGCANLGTKDYDGNWKLLHGVDYVLYAPDVTEEHPIEVQFRLFSRDAFIKFWEDLGLLRMKVSTAMRRRIAAQMGPDEKVTTDKFADVISIQSFANSGRKLPLVNQNLIGYPRLSDVDWDTIL